MKGPLGRIDFFLAEVEAATATRTVFNEGGLLEQIAHAPLGVVGNIPAWNYPWFVGGNVFIPALLTGNAVLYAPTVFSHVSHTMDLMREETFGPLIGIQKVSGGEEAVGLMNDSRYGLTAGVFNFVFCVLWALGGFFCGLRGERLPGWG